MLSTNVTDRLLSQAANNPYITNTTNPSFFFGQYTSALRISVTHRLDALLARQYRIYQVLY
jgi:hypothetical protein